MSLLAFIPLVLFAICFSVSPALPKENALLSSARDAWTDRDQEGRTLAAIALYEQALKANPEEKEAWVELTRALNRAVRRVPKKSEKEWAQRAVEAGKQTVLENPQSAEAYAYYAEAIGQWANANKGLGSLKRVKEAVKNLNKAIDINPRYAYAHMLLASFYQKAPSTISVGDKKKALEHARKAVEYGPAYAINHLTLAQVLLDYDKKDEAIRELKTVLSLKAPDDAIPETHTDQESAKKLLAELRAN